MRRLLFGFGLFVLGALCLQHGARGQMPGTFMPISVGVSGGGLACTPNTQGGGTDANVVALWHMDNAGTDTALGGARPLTLNGGAVYSTTQKKFGTHSLSIVTGGTSYAQMPAGVLIPASTDFTLETWMYFAGTTPTYHGWLGDDQATFLGPFGGPNLGIQIAGSTVSATTATTTNSFSPNAWHHYALTRLSGAIGVWVDGVTQTISGSNANVVGGTGSGAKIGRSYSATYVQPSGSFLDEVRLSNVARYTANFTPALLPFCDTVPPVSPYVGPGDVSSGATAWWGLRAYNKATASAGTQPIVNVRRSSDNATCDVLPKFSDGSLGLTSGCSVGGNNGLTLSAFCTSACFVAKQYDQTGARQCGGAACDAVQATAANQPALTVGCMGALPCLTYTTSVQTLNTAAGPSLAQPFSVSGVVKRTGATQGSFYVQGGNQQQFYFPTSGLVNQVNQYNGGSLVTSAAATDNVSHSVTGVWNGASSSIAVDGTNNAGLNLETTAGSGILSVGPGASTNALTGTISELGIWPRNLASEAAGLCSNQYGYAYGTACGVAPPPVCTVTGAGNTAAAFGGHSRYTMVVSGTITCPTGPRAVRHCIIGGGGSGGASTSGASGGGGGGMQVGSSASLANGANTVTVAVSVAGSSADGLDGQNSVALGLTATGGKHGIGVGTAAGGNAGTPAGAAGGAGSSLGGGGGGGGGPSGTPGLAPVTNAGKGGDGTICPIDGIQYAGGGGGVAASGLNDGGGAGINNAGGGSFGATIGSLGAQAGKVIIEEL